MVCFIVSSFQIVPVRVLKAKAVIGKILERFRSLSPVSCSTLVSVNDVDSIPTRQSLLARLKDVGDQESWREFFDTYWRLIHATALKAGLTQAEAEEVVQEVMIAAAKKMPEFT